MAFCNGPESHQSRNTDHSYEAPSRSYTINNWGQHASGQGTINNINLNQYNPSNPLEALEKHCSHTAAFDSAARSDPPRCTESTRLRIIEIIEEWINSDGDAASLFWLHGGAGVGKSALAQSLSETFQKKNQLAASFFFFRSDATRNNGDHLIPTLVSHLVDNFEEIVPFVEDGIRKNRTLFTKKYQVQIQELFIKPLLAMKSKGALMTHPRLIVIDGLDECEHSAVQCELLRVIARTIPQIPYPLRILVTSRPEAHITHLFNHDHDLQAIVGHQYNLSDDPDADMDIRRFLEKEFAEIRQVHCLRRHMPHDWPERKAISSLVERSSGHFVYSSTAIRHIRSPKHRPDNRLEVILRLRPPREGDQPFAQLDALYTFIFQGVEDDGQLKKICLVLGILYLQSRSANFFFSKFIPDCTNMEGLLEMEVGDLFLLLDPILSLVAIDGNKVRILHKSLFDYFLDFTRGGHLPFDLARVHELAATHILKQRIVKGVCDIEEFEEFAYHCQYAYLNDTLKNYLQSLEVPYPKFLLEMLLSCGKGKNSFMNSIQILFFFRTLSREDFDPTGQISEQYAAKWMSYLHSGCTQSRFMAALDAKVNNLTFWLKCKINKPPQVTESKPKKNLTVAEVNDLQRELDTLLREWKPQNFNPMDVRLRDTVRRVGLIKQECSIFSAYAIASRSDSPNTIISSVVCGHGDYFIHSYNIEIRDAAAFAFGGFMILQTYSKQGNAYYEYAFVTVPRIPLVTLGYLRMLEKCLFSDDYQKYGLKPDQDFDT